MALIIPMYSDFICPFCYVGFATMRKLKREFDFTIEYHGFQIHPEWPAEGMPAEKFRMGMDPEQRRAIWERIVAMGAGAGIEMKAPTTLANSRLALEANLFATEHGVAEAFQDGVFRAYFAEGLNIGERDVIRRIATDVGLDAVAITDALDAKRYAPRIEAARMRANQLGVSGVPTFYFGEYPLVGAQSEDVMRRVLARATQMAGAAK